MVEATKNICCEKGKGTIYYTAVTRLFKKVHSGCKNLDNQARLHRPVIMDSKAKFQAIEANAVNSTWRISG